MAISPSSSDNTLEEAKVRFVAVLLPKEYPVVLLIAGVLAMQCLVVGMVLPGKARGRVYMDEKV